MLGRLRRSLPLMLVALGIAAVLKGGTAAGQEGACAAPDPRDPKAVYDCMASQRDRAGNIKLVQEVARQDCAHIRLLYQSVLVSGGMTRNRTLQYLPSCHVISEVVAELVGTPPRWAPCLAYPGSSDPVHIRRCLANQTGGCETLQTAYLANLKAADPYGLPPSFYKRPGCDVIDAAREAPTQEAQGGLATPPQVPGNPSLAASPPQWAQCANYDPRHGPDHLKQCLGPDVSGLTTCTVVRSRYEDRLRQAYDGSLPPDYVALPCSQAQPIIALAEKQLEEQRNKELAIPGVPPTPPPATRRVAPSAPAISDLIPPTGAVRRTGGHIPAFWLIVAIGGLALLGAWQRDRLRGWLLPQNALDEFQKRRSRDPTRYEVVQETNSLLAAVDKRTGERWVFIKLGPLQNRNLLSEALEDIIRQFDWFALNTDHNAVTSLSLFLDQAFPDWRARYPVQSRQAESSRRQRGAEGQERTTGGSSQERRQEGSHAGHDGAGQQERAQSKAGPSEPWNLKGDAAFRAALEIMGLGASFTKAELAQRYRDLSRKIHPDAGGSTYFAKLLNWARDELKRHAK